MSASDYFSLIKDSLSRAKDRKPSGKLPISKLNWSKIKSKEDSLTWFGHCSFLLSIDNKKLFVDPMLGPAASPVSFAGSKRYSEDMLHIVDELPPIDAVFITHDHYDHLEYATIRHFRDKETLFIVPLGVGSHLLKWGVPPEKIRELGWGDEFSKSNISIVAERAVHFSARTWSSRNDTLWVSYALKGEQKRVYISGDTGYSEHFRDIGEKHGPFDIAFFEIDAWNPGWPKSHLFPSEVIQAYHDVQATSLVPVHWGVFDLALHPWDESIRMLATLANEDGNVNLLTPLMGQKLIPDVTKTSRWWEDVPSSRGASE
jgi:L-ascorbate metabolism protein UlaG (beta-lactamase superfamily)